MSIQYGGLIKKNPNISDLNALFIMLKIAHPKIKILSYLSKRGFIFEFKVAGSYSQYLTKSLTSSKFIRDQNSYILKVVLTSPEFKRYKVLSNLLKETETEQECFDEAILQNYLWYNSVIGDRPPICPSIASFMLFENSISLLFLKTIIEREYYNYNRDRDRFTKVIINTILQILESNHTFGLCIMLMENIDDAVTLSDIYRENDPVVGFQRNYDEYGVYIPLVLCEIIRSYIEFGVINFDLIRSNILISKASKKCFLIDYGSALVTHDNEHEERHREYFLDEFYYVESEGRDEEKIDFTKKVMNYIIGKDQERCQSRQIYQMDWYERVKIRPDFILILIKTFDLLKKSIIIDVDKPGIKRSTLDTYISQRKLINLDRSIDSFYVTKEDMYNVIGKPICEENSGKSCTIMGGNKKKYKKYKKSKKRKNKKNKNYNKTIKCLNNKKKKFQNVYL